MKLWLLLPVDGDDLWKPWYDKAFGFVVRAETEGEARAMANKAGGDEVRDFGKSYPAWTASEHSTCVELLAEGEPGIIIQDFHSA